MADYITIIADRLSNRCEIIDGTIAFILMKKTWQASGALGMGEL